MVITEKPKLLQLKKMAIGYLIFCRQKETDSASFAGERSLFFDMMNEETENLIKEIDHELKA